MRKRLTRALAATAGIAVLAIAGATVTIANFSPLDGATPDHAILENNYDAAIDQDGVPTPVVGSGLFILGAGDNAACMTANSVLSKLKADERTYGGKTVMLAADLRRVFSDEWRRKAHISSVPVSDVMAHLFSDKSGTDWTADVVEFNGKGCAMSRTLVPGDIWNDLLRTAMGIETAPRDFLTGSGAP